MSHVAESIKTRAISVSYTIVETFANRSTSVAERDFDVVSSVVEYRSSKESISRVEVNSIAQVVGIVHSPTRLESSFGYSVEFERENKWVAKSIESSTLCHFSFVVGATDTFHSEIVTFTSFEFVFNVVRIYAISDSRSHSFFQQRFLFAKFIHFDKILISSSTFALFEFPRESSRSLVNVRNSEVSSLSTSRSRRNFEVVDNMTAIPTTDIIKNNTQILFSSIISQRDFEFLPIARISDCLQHSAVCSTAIGRDTNFERSFRTVVSHMTSDFQHLSFSNIFKAKNRRFQDCSSTITSIVRVKIQAFCVVIARVTRPSYLPVVTTGITSDSPSSRYTRLEVVEVFAQDLSI